MHASVRACVNTELRARQRTHVAASRCVSQLHWTTQSVVWCKSMSARHCKCLKSIEAQRWSICNICKQYSGRMPHSANTHLSQVDRRVAKVGLRHVCTVHRHDVALNYNTRVTDWPYTKSRSIRDTCRQFSITILHCATTHVVQILPTRRVVWFATLMGRIGALADAIGSYTNTDTDEHLTLCFVKAHIYMGGN